jgi:hypothetical protein
MGLLAFRTSETSRRGLCRTSGMTPIERGMHALRAKEQGIDVKAYAVKVGRKQQNVSDEVCAARVVATVPDVRYAASDRFSQLASIHASPSWLWPALVEAMVAGGWTIEQTMKPG